MNSVQLDPDPGLFYPKTMMGVKDINVFPLYGQLKFTGSLDAPLFPTNGMLLTACALGTDNTALLGVTGSASTSAGSIASTSGPMYLSSSVSAASASMPITAQGQGFTNGASTFALVEQSEVVTITASTGTLLTTTRGALGTAAASHAANGGASVGNVLPGYVQVMKYGTTTTASIAAGSVSIPVTASTGIGAGGPITAGDFIQIGVNTATTTAEVRKVTLVTSLVLTLDTPTSFSHANGVCVLGVSAPFSHTIAPGNVLPSMILERNTGGNALGESLMFYGARINKLGLKVQATNSESAITADIIAQGASVDATPSAVSVADENPFVFFEAGISWFGTPVASMNQVTNFEFNCENGLKDVYTFNQTHTLQFLSSLTRKLDGKMDLVWNSFDDATYGYYTKMVNQSNLTLAPTQLNFALSHLTYAQGRVEVGMPKVNIQKYGDDLKVDDVVMSSIEYSAAYSISQGQSFVFVVNSPSQWLAF